MKGAQDHITAAEYQRRYGGGPSPARQRAGMENRESGNNFEELLDLSCRYYLQAGVAKIEKTPEPMKVIRKLLVKGKFSGQFVAHFLEKAQSDYQGTLKGGRSIAFEAKHTVTGGMYQSRVNEQQTKDLDAHQRMGAVCFVLIGFSMDRFYRIPWQVWKDMYRIYGRHHLKPTDIREFAVPMVTGGALLFLHKL